MKIIVEEKEIELELPRKNVTLLQVIDEVELFLFEVGKVPVALAFNGENLTQEQLEELQPQVLSGSEVLNFGVMSILDYLQQHLIGIREANQLLLQDMKAFACQIKEGSPSEGNKLVDGLRHFFEFWGKFCRMCPEGVQGIQANSRTLPATLHALQGLMEEVLKAMENSDFVLASDLLQFEVMPAIASIDSIVPLVQEKMIQIGKREAEGAAQAR